MDRSLSGDSKLRRVCQVLREVEINKNYKFLNKILIKKLIFKSLT